MLFKKLINYRIIYIKDVFKNEMSNILIIYLINVDIIYKKFKIALKHKLSIFHIIKISKDAFNCASIKNIKIRIISKDY